MSRSTYGKHLVGLVTGDALQPVHHRPPVPWLGKAEKRPDRVDQDSLDDEDDGSQQQVGGAEPRGPAAAEGGVYKVEGQLGAEVFLGGAQAAAEAVLVEAVLGPGAGVADAAAVLDAR